MRKTLGVAVIFKVMYTICDAELRVCESLRERNKESHKVTLRLCDECTLRLYDCVFVHVCAQLCKGDD